MVAQIGIAKIGLEADFAILDTLRLYIIPKSRLGERLPLDPFFTQLTGIADSDIQHAGQPLAKALEAVAAFSSGAKLWSWGKDEFNMIAISCYVEGFPPPLPAVRFGNACQLLLKAGMPYEDLRKTPSNRLAEHFELDHSHLRGHDALDDALSVAYVLQHLLRRKTLAPCDFA